MYIPALTEYHSMHAILMPGRGMRGKPIGLSYLPENNPGMKIALIVLFVILAVLACGCTAATPSGTAPAPSGTAAPASVTTTSIIPDLTGTWAGPSQGYDEGIGFTDYPDLALAFNVTEQHGRFFSGYVEFTWNGTRSALPMAGVISRDGATFAMVEKGSGYGTGSILGKDEIELTYMDDNLPFSIAVDSLKRA
jgi:hypothetical protein